MNKNHLLIKILAFLFITQLHAEPQHSFSKLAVKPLIKTDPAQALMVIKEHPIKIGDHFGGGIVACLQGGLKNLIASTTDNSKNIPWSMENIAIGNKAQSKLDGSANTKAIVNVLGSGKNYAAQLCAASTNGGYSDWFLPSKSQLACLEFYSSKIGNFDDSFYWTSTEVETTPAQSAWVIYFAFGSEYEFPKNYQNGSVRCVRLLVE